MTAAVDVATVALGEKVTHFQRLERGFAALGWALYPLDGNTVMVTIPTLGMSRNLPDLHAAQTLLRQIGGA